MITSSPAESLTARRFPELAVSTPRLLVRPLVADDVDSVTAVFADPKVARWLPVPERYGKADGYAWCLGSAAQRRKRGEGDHFGIVRRADGQLVGCAWAKRTDWSARSTEVWLAMGAAARGYGFGPETLGALTVALLLEHGFHRIELRVAAGNVAARRVAEKSGFSYEGLLRNAGQLRESRVDLELWSLVTADLR